MCTKKLAYQLWEEAGKPDGKSEYFWHEAQAIIAVYRSRRNFVLDCLLKSSDIDIEYEAEYIVKIINEITGINHTHSYLDETHMQFKQCAIFGPNHTTRYNIIPTIISPNNKIACVLYSQELKDYIVIEQSDYLQHDILKSKIEEFITISNWR